MIHYHKNELLSTANIGGFFIFKNVYTVYQEQGTRNKGPVFLALEKRKG